MSINTTYKRRLADTLTPVQIYLKLRDQYPGSLLLESSDHKALENNFSYICCNPIAEIKADSKFLTTQKAGNTERMPLPEVDINSALHRFSQSFNYREFEQFSFKTHGLFGYISYDAVPLFESITFNPAPEKEALPLLYFKAFRNVIVYDHFHNEIFIFDHAATPTTSNCDKIITLLKNHSVPQFKFTAETGETSNCSDADFIKNVTRGIEHCQLGDVFQIVLSRKYRKHFKGDDFNLYRALRSINPSPYAFYFDYGNFKLFGSSPEAQLIIEEQNAIMFPIAGTFKRTGDSAKDRGLAEQLQKDRKENAEHQMLVDLARNDLSRNSSAVKVERLQEIEYFSHVIHLVSKVSARIEQHANPVKVLSDTYPAGTLSGAPKYEAMKLINRYEPESRGVYGGCVGMLGFDDSVNMAIVIRSFVSRHSTLEYQAGAGVVSQSIPEKELQEVHNKLEALRVAIEHAKTL